MSRALHFLNMRSNDRIISSQILNRLAILVLQHMQSMASFFGLILIQILIIHLQLILEQIGIRLFEPFFIEVFKHLELF